ncbi:energy transducer TonB [Sphingomonas silueang]|uniref:energy transducer TonB n=1 Tax=Sphingomonas silueang TaxID=3156617 RepID=UPI0032B4648A
MAQTGPVPIDPGSWVTPDDYPVTAMREGQEGVVRTKLTIDAAGKVTACEGSGATPLLNDTTCGLLSARAAFQPARDAAGKPIASTAQLRFSWNLPNDGLESFAIAYRVTIGTGGELVRCEFWTSADAAPVLQPCPGDDKMVGALMAGNQQQPGVLTYITEDRVNGAAAAKAMFRSDVPPRWTREERMTIDADGRVSDCRVVDSADPAATCSPSQLFKAEPGRAPVSLIRTTSTAFQPAK